MRIEAIGRIKTWKKKEKSWGIIEIEFDAKKYVRSGKAYFADGKKEYASEGALMDVQERFEFFVGGKVLDHAIAWDRNTEKKLSIEVHSDTVGDGAEERHFVNLSIWKIEDADKPSFKNIAGNDNNNIADDDDDLPF